MPTPSNYNSEYNNFTTITNLHNKIHNNVGNINKNVNVALRRGGGGGGGGGGSSSYMRTPR